MNYFKHKTTGQVLSEDDIEGDDWEMYTSEMRYKDVVGFVLWVLQVIVKTEFKNVKTLKGACKSLSWALDPEKNPRLKG